MKPHILAYVLLAPLVLSGVAQIAEAKESPPPTIAYAYVTHGCGHVYEYTLNSKGTLAQFGNIKTGSSPSGIAISPNNDFLYIPDFSCKEKVNLSSISAYTITSGKLKPVTGSPYTDVGLNPDFAVVSPSGQFLYVDDTDNDGNTGSDGGVSVYSINPTTGALTQIAGSPFLTMKYVYQLAITPNGKYLYIAGYPGVYGFSVNTSTGQLTPLVGSPFGSQGPDSVPFGLTIDPSGNYVYVTDQHYDEVFVYSIDSSTGALTEITGLRMRRAMFPP